jgi:hypothetical protein
MKFDGRGAADRGTRVIVRALVALSALAMTLAAPAAAFALSGESASGSAAAAQYSVEKASSGGLPFTGYLVISVLLAGLIALSLGLAIRRRANAEG